MAADRGASLPIAALGVIALFLSTTFLGPSAFDLLRMGESDADKRLQISQPPVESRLWEDPFAALARHRAKLKELCAPVVGAGGAQVADARCARGEMSARSFRKRISEDEADVTVLAAMVPGAAFIGVEEARRRVRYAVLAGLQAEDFVPEDSEHMGLLRVRPCETFFGCGPEPDRPQTPLQRMTATVQWLLPPASPKMEFLYETFGARSRSDGRYRRAVVLWIDDTALGPRWISTLARILNNVAPDDSTVRIIGPYKSDDLVRGLDDLAELAKVPAWEKPFMRSSLERLRLVSPFSTAPAEQLRDAAKPVGLAPECKQAGLHPTLGTDCTAKACPNSTSKDAVDDLFRERLRELGICRDTPFFVRTIGTDDRQIELLTKELRARGVAAHTPARIVLLSEWDSIYARSFEQTLRQALDCKGGREECTLRNYPYLRGLDGANVDGATKQVRLVPRGTDKAKDDKTPAIEWPESRDQRDYVRRLVARLQQNFDLMRPGTDVRAIGLIGNDVHDKLILAQALRAAFPDRILFTTDLDTRLLHPEVIRYTRNMVVASSLPLNFFDRKSGTTAGPFRDQYQTATYLAVRYAAAATDRSELIARQLGTKHLYEVGRYGVVRLGVDTSTPDEMRRRWSIAALIGLTWLGFGIFSIGWVPGPSMKLAWSASGAQAAFQLSTALISGLQFAAGGFALGVALELGLPGQIGLGGAVLLAALFALAFWAFRYPGIDRTAPSARRWAAVLLRLLFIAAVGGLLWWALPKPVDGAMREPFDLVSGVSAWPSQLLCTLVILLFAWFLDYAWTESREAAQRLSGTYFPLRPCPAVADRPRTLGRQLAAALLRKRDRFERRWRLLRRSPDIFFSACLRHARRGLSEASIWFWSPPIRRGGGGVIDGKRLWRHYLNLLRNGPHLCRIVLWLVVALVMLVLAALLMDDMLPDVPARGLDDRQLFSATAYAAAFGTVVLLILVADAAVLTFRFIYLLKGARTCYPRETVERFAKELGTDPVLREAALDRVAAGIPGRDQPGARPRNSLLDDWIDARLLADHTAAVAPLIIAPFVLVALLVVARSPLFDNWSNGGAVLATLVAYLLGSIAMAALLNVGAEMARRKAVESMRQDLLWLEGSGKKYEPMAKRFPGLIDQIVNLRRGAFAPFFEQPLVQAILVPLGGAGGIQLLDLLVFARS